MQLQANGIGIEVDDQGLPNGEPLLLIMGLGMQMLGWPDELVQMLVSRGFRVIRFDNRDTGLSTGFDQAGVPNLAWAAMRHMVRLPVTSPYSLGDMANDAVGVLDALGISKAHVCGASMGGMIAQHMAAMQPQRVKSLGLLMTSSGARHLPQPSLRVRRALLSRPEGSNSEAVVAHLKRVLAVIGSPAFPPDPSRQDARLRTMVQRAWRPAGTARQLLAVAADGDRSAMLKSIAAPARIMHGLADPLIPVAAAHDLAKKMPGAVLDLVPGMGHDLPLQVLPGIAAGLAENAARVS